VALPAVRRRDPHRRDARRRAARAHGRLGRRRAARDVSVGDVTMALRIPLDAGIVLEGDLVVPRAPRGLVIFAHGSGSSRLSPRNRMVAAALQDRGFATLLFDLLTAREEIADRITGHLRFDVRLLARRLVGASDWIVRDSSVLGLPLGY